MSPSKSLRDAVGREGGVDLALLWPAELAAPDMTGWTDGEEEPATAIQRAAAIALIQPSAHAWHVLGVTRALLQRPMRDGVRGALVPHLVAHVATDRSLSSARRWAAEGRERPLKFPQPA